MSKKPSVALVGAGSMGGSLLRGWLDSGAIEPAQSAVFDPGLTVQMRALCEQHGVAVNPDAAGFRAEAIVLGIKPQAAEDALPQYGAIAKDALVISVMAGKSIASVSRALGGAKKIARVMPNLPAAIGKGVSGLYAPEQVDADGRALIETLMAAAGETVWVDAEEQIDFVTAISGSGPAYYFLLTEALAEAGEALGLSNESAAKLALATLTGAGALMDVESRTPAEMRRAVTSPGGTTEAALQVFDGDDAALRNLVKKAVAAAAKRGRALTD